MRVTLRTRAELAKRRAARREKTEVEDKAWGQACFKLFWRGYKFRGSDQPTGAEYWLCAQDRVVQHGIVFGSIENAKAELPALVRDWDIPILKVNQEDACPI